MDTGFPFIKRRHFKKKRKVEVKKREYTFINETKKLEFLRSFLFQGIKISEVDFVCNKYLKAA